MIKWLLKITYRFYVDSERNERKIWGNVHKPLYDFDYSSGSAVSDLLSVSHYN